MVLQDDIQLVVSYSNQQYEKQLKCSLYDLLSGQNYEFCYVNDKRIIIENDACGWIITIAELNHNDTDSDTDIDDVILENLNKWRKILLENDRIPENTKLSLVQY